MKFWISPDVCQEVRQLENDVHRKDALITKYTEQLRVWEEQAKLSTVDVDHSLPAFHHFQSRDSEQQKDSNEQQPMEI